MFLRVFVFKINFVLTTKCKRFKGKQGQRIRRGFGMELLRAGNMQLVLSTWCYNLEMSAQLDRGPKGTPKQPTRYLRNYCRLYNYYIQLGFSFINIIPLEIFWNKTTNSDVCLLATYFKDLRNLSSTALRTPLCSADAPYDEETHPAD